MPEEINRVLTDHVSSLLLAPTAVAVENLAREGISGSAVCRVGDVMYDAALFYSQRARQTSRILNELGLAAGQYVLATIHRAENTDSPPRLRAIVGGLALAAREQTVILPLHPRTRASLSREGLADSVSGQLRVINPVGYLDMAMLEASAALVVTDSGGVQKEAFFQGVPCVTLRDETEWVELVHAGWNRLCPPTSAEAVAAAVRQSLGTTGEPITPYGDGRASEKIVELLRSTRNSC
jgi:UDP-GlcNAc3NAcA epimerase